MVLERMAASVAEGCHQVSSVFSIAKNLWGAHKAAKKMEKLQLAEEQVAEPCDVSLCDLTCPPRNFGRPDVRCCFNHVFSSWVLRRN